jgi:hypothetical protein
MLNLYRKHRLLVSVAGGLFLLVLVVVLSRCTQIRNLISPTSQDLSTPELIEQALGRGEITEEERLLYLAYALYEHESLPARFESSFEWFGDVAANELDEVVDSPAKLCSMSSHVRSELLRLIKKTNVDTVCN